LAEMTK